MYCLLNTVWAKVSFTQLKRYSSCFQTIKPTHSKVKNIILFFINMNLQKSNRKYSFTLCKWWVKILVYKDILYPYLPTCREILWHLVTSFHVIVTLYVLLVIFFKTINLTKRTVPITIERQIIGSNFFKRP